MNLKQRLTEDMKTAMKAGEKDRLLVIRLINAAIKQREVDERVELDDAQVLAALEKMVKQRKDSVTQFEAADREDLAAVERAEIEVIQRYLPEKMGEAEVQAAIDAAIAETGASGPADMGKLMGVLKPRLAGQPDMGQVSALVKKADGLRPHVSVGAAIAAIAAMAAPTRAAPTAATPIRSTPLHPAHQRRPQHMACTGPHASSTQWLNSSPDG